jgi:hypothetical protein
MTELGKTVQKKMLELKIDDYLEKDALKEFLSFLEGICDQKYADDLICEVAKDVESYAKNFELNFQREDEENEDIEFTCLNPKTPEYLKKNASKIFTPWDEESQKLFKKSVAPENLKKFKNYLESVKPDSE